jgi:hypothetical protein
MCATQVTSSSGDVVAASDSEYCHHALVCHLISYVVVDELKLVNTFPCDKGVSFTVWWRSSLGIANAVAVGWVRLALHTLLNSARGVGFWSCVPDLQGMAATPKFLMNKLECNQCGLCAAYAEASFQTSPPETEPSPVLLTGFQPVFFVEAAPWASPLFRPGCWLSHSRAQANMGLGLLGDLVGSLYATAGR